MITMICENCKVEREQKDFLKNQKFCFRCEYRKKLEKVPKKQTKKPLICRICKAEIIQQEDAKKRQRFIFCSIECAKKGHKFLIDNYWTRQLGGRIP